MSKSDTPEQEKQTTPESKTGDILTASTLSKSDTPAQEKQATPESKTGDILTASTTLASLVIALVVLLPDHASLIKVNQIVFSIGGLGLPLGLALLFCGLCALTASIWAVDGMRRDANLPVRSLLLPKTNLSFLFLALCLFCVIYITVMEALLGGAK